MRTVTIFVEGKADKRFIEDYLTKCFGVENASKYVVSLDGKDNFWSEKELVKIVPHFEKNTDRGGANFLIFDADDDFDSRKAEILQQKEKLGIEFDLFLFPNNSDSGALEELLYQIVNPKHEVILECFEKFQDCLKDSKNDYSLPDIKAQMNSYTSALLPKKQRRFANETKRRYLNPDHWNLNAEYLQPFANSWHLISLKNKNPRLQTETGD